MTSRRWPFVSSGCRVDPATITHKESIYWIHTTEGCDRERDGKTIAGLQTSIAEFFNARSIFPVDQHPLPGQHPRWVPIESSSDVLLYDISFIDTRFHRYQSVSSRIRSARFRVSRPVSPAIVSANFFSHRSPGEQLCQVPSRGWGGALWTDLSAGRHATAAFPSRFGASSRRVPSRKTPNTQPGTRHVIRSIPRPLRYSVARNAAILLHIHLAPYTPPGSPRRRERGAVCRFLSATRQTKRRGTLVFEGFN